VSWPEMFPNLAMDTAIIGSVLRQPLNKKTSPVGQDILGQMA
jgi:hypothetical protein